MRNRITFLITPLLFGLAFSFSLAQENPSRPALDDIKKDVEKVSQLKNADLSSLVLRKQVLTKILLFTEGEVRDLRGKVSGLSNLDGDELLLQSQLLSKLDIFPYHLNNFKEAVQNIKSSDEAKAFATSLKSWRERYLDQAKKINDWLTYFNVNGFLQRANERYRLIEGEVVAAGDQLKNADAILENISKAKESLHDAAQNLAYSKSIILDYYMEIDGRQPSADKFVDPVNFNVHALNDIKDAYLIFLQLSLKG